MNCVAGALLVGLGLLELRAARGHSHGHHHHDHGEGADKGLWVIAGAAFALGFAHEEEFEIIGLCAGSYLCRELMLVYALAVIVALTLLLIAGYEGWRHRLEHFAPHLPKLSAAILIALGLGFIAGWL